MVTIIFFPLKSRIPATVDWNSTEWEWRDKSAYYYKLLLLLWNFCNADSWLKQKQQQQQNNKQQSKSKWSTIKKKYIYMYIYRYSTSLFPIPPMGRTKRILFVLFFFYSWHNKQHDKKFNLATWTCKVFLWNLESITGPATASKETKRNLHQHIWESKEKWSTQIPVLFGCMHFSDLFEVKNNWFQNSHKICNWDALGGKEKYCSLRPR